MSGFDGTLRILSIAGWLYCLACLTPAVWRLLRGKGRYQDPIWGIVFLLAVNRLTFLARVSAEFSHATAFALALTLGSFSVWYQRRDA